MCCHLLEGRGFVRTLQCFFHKCFHVLEIDNYALFSINLCESSTYLFVNCSYRLDRSRVHIGHTHTHHSFTHNSRGKLSWYDAPLVNVAAIEVSARNKKCMNEALNITCNMFCFSHLSGVKPGYREQVVASLPGTMAPATQCVSSLFPPAVCGRTAQNRSVQPQSAAPR